MFGKQQEAKSARGFFQNLEQGIGGLNCQRFRFRDQADLEGGLNGRILRLTYDLANLADADSLLSVRRGEFENVRVNASFAKGTIRIGLRDDGCGDPAAF